MKPVSFNGVTTLLRKPDSMTDAECGPLPVFNDGHVSVSCWQMSLSERIRALVSGHIWLRVRAGNSQPPVSLSVDRPITKR